MAQKPSIPKGTRDFGPQEMACRNYIFNTIRQVYALYGFQQIETPAQETLATLMGKYGEEGDKLLFKILNSGDFLKGISGEDISHGATGHLAAQLCEKGLRYDLTVPFARYVVQHREELTLPFRRYQIQPVWRADRPQKGRYREFYQCDADVVGSDSLLNEVELMQIVDTVFQRFGIRVCIKINNRKILSGIAEMIGAADKIVDITVAIDKLDKIGLENVNAELLENGLSEAQVEKLQPIISLSGSNTEKIATMRQVLAGIEVGQNGLDEVEYVLSKLSTLNSQLELDLTLARGLNYYTGCIFEVKALDVQIGSITGGGRYDNLTGIFGMPGISGVGISFGAPGGGRGKKKGKEREGGGKGGRPNLDFVSTGTPPPGGATLSTAFFFSFRPELDSSSPFLLRPVPLGPVPKPILTLQYQNKKNEPIPNPPLFPLCPWIINGKG